ncbi:MAG: adenosylcobalamin-dependent ribonucleoside-diphosphate reductase [Neomegalonema sp.]|nr:adenosylcobalamin-dependent ribonucleoside-diphosphate reductase [Neomegalonema sp.]
MTGFDAPIAEYIWDLKYRLKGPTGGNATTDATVDDTWRRVAKAVAQPEAEADRAAWEDRFYNALSGFQFLPAGRILAGAGADRTVTLFNCFVMGRIPDDMAGIFEMLKEAALTMQQGGGIGYDFSTIRPKGAAVAGVASDASGPISFMDVWDAMCRTIMSAGSRRGAMMATLRCDHPDIEEFIAAKAESARLRNFNLSVLATDAFMTAVREGAKWDLVFEGRLYRTVDARSLWDGVMKATYDYAEPGVIFIDRINRRNNLHYCEDISATNPCGEQPLPPYGACLLGSINLARLVEAPFEAGARIDEKRLRDLVAIAVRMMDNVVDVSRFPLEAQRREAIAKRRIGLGVTGLADALAMLRLRYGAPDAVAQAGVWLRRIRDAAYQASIDLAAEKGAFPLFDKDAYLAGESIAELPEALRNGIAEYGVRNALLTSIAPTGTISLYAGNVSSGIEPIFAASYERKVTQNDGSKRAEQVLDYAVALYRAKFGENAALPDYFVTAQDLPPEAHVATQAEAQKWVDSAISKTINLPADISFEAFKSVYIDAYEQGCKGCTTYRPNDVTGSVLSAAEPAEQPTPEPARVVVDDAAGGRVVHLREPLDRPESLLGATYKLRWPDSPHATYITINDIVEDGRRRPFEVFINSKNMEHYAWTVALTRMISAVFRRGGDVSFVVEELKAVFDPRGGFWSGGKYTPSILAAIGEVIERHMREIGFIEAQDADRREAATRLGGRGLCPHCGAGALAMVEGCPTCLECGHSKCG